MNEQVVKALKEIKNKCGEDTFSDINRFKGAVSDLLPGSDRELIRIRKRLVDTAELGAYNRLKQANAKNEIGAECSHLVKELCEEGIETELAQDIIRSFAALFTEQKHIEIAKIKTVSNQNTFTDPRDGKVYKTVKIGNQVWMAENLNFDCPGSRCYDDDPKNAEKYGRLYNWTIAKKACPTGWHLPSKKEWQTLVNFAGGNEIAGKKLKAKDGWNKNCSGTDNYGFSALPGGYGRSEGSFYNAGGGHWWSSSESNSNSGNSADGLYICCDNLKRVHLDNNHKSKLLYIRCLQNKAK